MQINTSSFYEPGHDHRYVTALIRGFSLNTLHVPPKASYRLAVMVDDLDPGPRRRYLRDLQHDRSYQNSSLREKVIRRRAILRSLVSIA